MTTALVMGVNGQDGVFLARHLAARGYDVVGVARQDRPSPRLDGLPVTYVPLDLGQPDALSALLAEHRPALALHAAAVHGSADSRFEPDFLRMLAVNCGSLHPLLEHARLADPAMRIVYISSSKVFGPRYPAVVNERSPRTASCLYTTSKMAAEGLLSHYRRAHGVKASILYTFNHESEFRQPSFFTAKLADALAQALRSPEHRSTFMTLDFHCDWGSASEFMDLACDIAEKAIGEDVVLGSGTTVFARTVARDFFAKHGLELDRHVVTTQPPRPDRKDDIYQVDIAALERLTGRRPALSILDVLDHMLAARQAEL